MKVLSFPPSFHLEPTRLHSPPPPHKMNSN
ncbi:protein of unknown function (plasmid) [Cupriavidus taiwanensis]|uniref:Uncharacterized protein n=1 Tax=Cupriavidus taiwanensis TaxID=164546 RepID=A0A375DNC9_9BURK|nr:hypothetical protein CBM2585_B20548 [Cupriavidus taiwanensis]SOZ09309.1 protein of unknown function [Cupriavidus taiwanensis]SOZ11434.1 protein of unknown function [Cupriavidus taiwanensis]SOZ42787.1 protein of unknown function [Cupriavidus taiwanensis]SPC19838.1 hypothetical protein CT19431_MP70015 [Cupriavidus taiwanensis]